MNKKYIFGILAIFLLITLIVLLFQYDSYERVAKTFLEKYYEVTDNDLARVDRLFEAQKDVQNFSYDDYYSELYEEYSGILTADAIDLLAKTTVLDDIDFITYTEGIYYSIDDIKINLEKKEEKRRIYEYEVQLTAFDTLSNKKEEIIMNGQFSITNVEGVIMIDYAIMDFVPYGQRK